MNKYLNNIEYGTLAFFLINSFFINVGYNLFTSTSLNDSILDILIGSILILILLSIILFIRSYYKKDLLNIINNSILKYPLLLIITISLSISTIYSITIISKFIHYYILKDANIFTISLTLIFIIYYLVSKNIKTISKVSNIFFYIYIILSFIGLIGTTSYVDVNNLKPFMTISISDHIKSIIMYFNYSILPIFLILTFPYHKNEHKNILVFSILSLINIIICLTLIISILGIDLTNIYIYPNIAIYKKISFLNILERIETFLAFNELLNSIFIISISLNTVKHIIITNLNIKKERIVLIILSILILFISNFITVSKNIYLTINTIFLIIIIFLFIRTIIDKYILN